MTYRQAVDFYHSRLRFGMQPGLSRIKRLLHALGDPQGKLRFVHVAGTNGKGTTANMLSRILVEAGYKTGLFTSPYVFSFCERMQIDHQNIGEAELARITARVKTAVEEAEKAGEGPTEFETITAAALLYFYEAHCDIVVLEVGLGGRLDSTNIIPCPLVSVITSIALDHTAVLGDTLGQIAAEKAGILKEGGHCVTTANQPPEAMQVLRTTAEEWHNTFTAADPKCAETLSERLGETIFRYGGETYMIPLCGVHQVENAVTVIEAAKLLRGVTMEHVRTGLAKSVMHGRMERVARCPDVLLDGGHNPECGQALAGVLRRFAPKDLTAVIGMMEDKDTAHYLAQILPFCRRVIFTKPDNPRAASPESLAETAQSFSGEVRCVPDPQKAYEQALSVTPENGMVLVCGSFYLLSDITF